MVRVVYRSTVREDVIGNSETSINVTEKDKSRNPALQAVFGKSSADRSGEREQATSMTTPYQLMRLDKSCDILYVNTVR